MAWRKKRRGNRHENTRVAEGESEEIDFKKLVHASHTHFHVESAEAGAAQVCCSELGREEKRQGGEAGSKRHGQKYFIFVLSLLPAFSHMLRHMHAKGGRDSIGRHRGRRKECCWG